MRVLEPFFNANFDENYSRLKNRAKEILAAQDSLQEIVQLVGRESLSEDQKVRADNLLLLLLLLRSVALCLVLLLRLLLRRISFIVFLLFNVIKIFLFYDGTLKPFTRQMKTSILNCLLLCCFSASFLPPFLPAAGHHGRG